MLFAVFEMLHAPFIEFTMLIISFLAISAAYAALPPAIFSFDDMKAPRAGPLAISP